VDQQKIAEYVTHSWFEYDDGNAAKHPWDGETKPRYTGPQPPYEWLETDQKYSWIKAPRYEDAPMEVGPLARMLIAYVKGHERVKFWVDAALAKLEVGPEVLFSTLGRTAARGIETVVLAEKVTDWVDELTANMGKGDLRIHETEHWDPDTWPKEAMGWGWSEAPRGALGHWVRIKDGAIANYQCIVPSTWNASPRDATGQRGAYESALLETPVADPEQPIEILRTLHSFDPCMACAVHVTDPDRREITRIQIV
jgi:Ni,Fe-hydrogenase I large subunit